MSQARLKSLYLLFFGFAIVIIAYFYLQSAQSSKINQKVNSRFQISADNYKSPLEPLTNAEKSLSGKNVVSVIGAPSFDRCGRLRETCVVDGDTFWLRGIKMRIADIDAPEIHEPKCDYERELGARATTRLIALLNSGEFDLHSDPANPQDRYGRLLVVVKREGRSIGKVLIADGLARPWRGRREPWC